MSEIKSCRDSKQVDDREAYLRSLDERLESLSYCNTASLKELYFQETGQSSRCRDKICSIDHRQRNTPMRSKQFINEQYCSVSSTPIPFEEDVLYHHITTKWAGLYRAYQAVFLSNIVNKKRENNFTAMLEAPPSKL